MPIGLLDLETWRHIAMSNQNGRRTFLSWLGAGLSCSAVMAANSSARASGPQDEKRPYSRKTYEGTSKKGDVDEALDLAIKAAQNSAPGTDRQVTWTLKEVAGREGGLAGFNEVTVTIDARIS
jgi:hypothetical protein